MLTVVIKLIIMRKRVKDLKQLQEAKEMAHSLLHANSTLVDASLRTTWLTAEGTWKTSDRSTEPWSHQSTGIRLIEPNIKTTIRERQSTHVPAKHHNTLK
jgi:hypothetical protein